MYFNYDVLSRHLEFCPEPTYTFKVGDDAVVDGLECVVVEECLNDGKIYRISHLELTCKSPIKYTKKVKVLFWYNLRPYIVDKKEGPLNSFRVPCEIKSNRHNCSMGELLFKIHACGMDFEPYTLEREWTLVNKQTVICNIFNNEDIGKIVLREKGFNAIYGYDILVGRQLIMAIKDYFENRYPYEGKYFNDLSELDQKHFNTFGITITYVQ